MITLRIIGVDPGSRFTGYGVVDFERHCARRIASGCIRTDNAPMADRLLQIHDNLKQIVATHQPQQMAIEKVFVHRNPGSALKLGQARGVAMLAGIASGLALYEYSPNEIKLALVGRGHADKSQINHMVRALLGLPKLLQEDEADALAIAICHGHTAISNHHQRRLTDGATS